MFSCNSAFKRVHVMKHSSSRLVLVSWAKFTPVKILYNSYSSSHNTAKCKKKAQHAVLQGIFLSYHLVLSSLCGTIKEAKQRPLVYKMLTIQIVKAQISCSYVGIKRTFLVFCSAKVIIK